jgi:hypothetical protein
MMGFTYKMLDKPKGYGVKLVIPSVAPFKIVRDVVDFVSVNVVYLRKLVSIGYESYRNKAMNSVSSNSGVFVKSDMKVAVWCSSWLKYLFAPIDCRFNSTDAGYMVLALIVLYGLPDFIHGYLL